MNPQINPELIEKLEETFPRDKVGQEKDLDAALQYLLCIYFDLAHGVTIPYNIIRTVNILKICERDFGKGVVIWHIPLFLSTKGESSVDENWGWVQDYRQLFHPFKPMKKLAMGDEDGTLRKMKKFFMEHPHVRKEQVMAATIAYVRDYHMGKENPTYITQADYFISKRVDGVMQSKLYSFIQNLKEDEEEGQDRYKVTR